MFWNIINVFTVICNQFSTVVKLIWNIFVHAYTSVEMWSTYECVFNVVLAFLYMGLFLVFDDEGVSRNLSILASGLLPSDSWICAKIL